MPLLDHFGSPLSDGWPWDGIHANWATKIADLLNAGCLPPEYHAISLIKRARAARRRHGRGLVPKRGHVNLDLLAFDEEDLFEVQVIRQFGGARLRAAVELVSPSNKDRPASRRAFGVKCASYLCQGIAVVIIDVVTERQANLHAELMGLLDVNGGLPWQSPTNLSAVAYRIAGADGARRLETWCESLAVGAPLPTVPLWLEPDLSVPLRLEESYRSACTSLRIPV